ncbi:hypothetical protein Q9233_003142 [Columba guinea]|nr:hypothetical protein Q9233_003142 [Columba guinea]
MDLTFMDLTFMESDFYGFLLTEEASHDLRCFSVWHKFGLDELKTQFLVSTLARDFVACFRISEAGSGSDVTSIHVAKKRDKLGMRSSDTAQNFFEDERVLKKNLIGEEGKSFTYQMLQFQEKQLQE